MLRATSNSPPSDRPFGTARKCRTLCPNAVTDSAPVLTTCWALRFSTRPNCADHKHRLSDESRIWTKGALQQRDTCMGPGDEFIDAAGG